MYTLFIPDVAMCNAGWLAPPLNSVLGSAPIKGVYLRVRACPTARLTPALSYRLTGLVKECAISQWLHLSKIFPILFYVVNIVKLALVN